MMATKYAGKYPNKIKMAYGMNGGKSYLFVTNSGEKLEMTTVQLRALGFTKEAPTGIDISALKGGYSPNPSPRKTRISRSNITEEQYVNRPSQITRKTPTKRAKARRQTHLDSGLPPGYYPNPVRPMDTVYVLVVNKDPMNVFSSFKLAEKRAKYWHENNPEFTVEIHSALFSE